MKKYLLIISTLFLSVAANAQWTSQATTFSAVSRGIQDVSAVNATTVWVCAYDGSGGGANVQDFAKTTDGGTTWTSGTVSAPASHAWSNICAIDGNTAWACFYDAVAGAGGGIWKTTDGGATWNQQGSGTIFNATSFPNVVYFGNASLGFAMGDPNGGYFEIYTTIDGGNTWARSAQANIPAPLAGEYGTVNVFDVVGATIWFGTTKGRVYKSINGGINWTVATTGLANVTDIVMLDANNGLVVENTATTSTLKSTTDGGATWTAVTPSGTYYSSDLESIPGTAAYVCTGAATGMTGSAYSVDGGTTWVGIDAGVQHTAQGWINGTTGWCGGFNTSASADGIFKYTGAGLGVSALNRDNARMRLFPSPSNGKFTIQIGGAETKDATVKIVDLAGSIVYSGTIENSSTVIEKNFDLSGIAKGIYFVNVQNGTTSFVNKLILK